MRRALLIGIGFCLAGALVAGSAVVAQDGFKPLFDGQNVEDFEFEGVDESTYSLDGDVIVCQGVPEGYSATRKAYKNYHLRFDWKYARPANLEKDADFNGKSGALVHITGPGKVWPKSVEVVLDYRDAGNVVGHDGAKLEVKRHADAQTKARKPVGEWNTTEIICKDGKLTSKLNGETVAEATGVEPADGRIGWQSQGSEIHFRNLALKSLE